MLNVLAATSSDLVAAREQMAFTLAVHIVLASLGGSFPAIEGLTNYLSIIDHFDDFGKGVLDTTHLIYYVSFITFGLFLTAKSVDSERWRG